MSLTGFLAGKAISGFFRKIVARFFTQDRLTRAAQGVKKLSKEKEPPRLPGITNHEIDLPPLRMHLLEKLRALQNVWPAAEDHLGEFRGSSGRFGSNTNDPWMYQTLWATRVIGTRSPAYSHIVNDATSSIKRLLARHKDGRILTSSAGDDVDHRQFPIISIRHTICAALIFHVTSREGGLSTSIISHMTDPYNKWQNRDGGWAKTQDERTTRTSTSDLWGSAYAAELLQLSLQQDGLLAAARTQQVHALQETIKYLRESWGRNRWGIRGGSPTEENAVLMLVQLAPLLATTDKPFFDVVVEQCKSWMNPNRGLKSDYIETCLNHPKADINISALYTRMSYALYRAGEATEWWLPLYIKALIEFDKIRQELEKQISRKPQDPLSSADLSFLVDLSYAAEEQTGSKLISTT